MNRKEMGCAVVGAVLGAAGCAPAVKSLAVPVADAETAGSTAAQAAKNMPHLSEAILTLISGTSNDMSTAIFRLEPHSGWSVSSNDPRLQVSLVDGHEALLQAPEDEKVQFVGIASIEHVDGLHFKVRCHVEAGC
jgi:hypothetical protein